MNADPAPTVFVVDDDPSIRRALTRVIQSVGLATETYPGAQQFLDAYDPARLGCLVLDIRMPHLDGLELQALLDRQGFEIPIIFITGHGDVRTSVRAMKLGASGLLAEAVQRSGLARGHQASPRPRRGPPAEARRAQ